MNTAKDMFVMNKVGENNNKFDTIVRNSGNGGVIYVTLGESSELKIQNAEFINCETKGADDGRSYGGAIYIDYANKEAKLSVSDVTFTDCVASYSGGSMYLDFGVLPEKNEYVTWSNVEFYDNDGISTYRGKFFESNIPSGKTHTKELYEGLITEDKEDDYYTLCVGNSGYTYY